MYSIKKVALGKFEEVVMSCDNTGEWASVIPALGCRLNSLYLLVNGAVHSVLTDCRDEDTLLQKGIPEFRGAQLFPYPNRVEAGNYFHNGNPYQLDIHPSPEGNALHGMVHDKPFKLIHSEANTTSATSVFQYKYAGTHPGYPFPYTLTNTFILSASGLECKTTLENTGDETMIWGHGWHPYFNFPDKINNVEITLPVVKSFGVNKNQIPDGTYTSLQLNQQSIAEKEFDTCFEVNDQEIIQESILIDRAKGYRLSYWQEAGPGKYTYLQVYTPAGRTSIAIEPMTCAPNAFNNLLGLNKLEPGGAAHISCGINLHTL